MVRKNAKVLLTALLILAMALVQTACFGGDTESKKEIRELELCYVKQAYVDEEDVTEPFVRYKATIEIPKELVKKAEDEKDSYAAVGAINMLKTAPPIDGATTVIASDVVINNVTIKYDTAVVDIAGDSIEGTGGSTEESLFISQIVKTLLDSFDSVSSVQFVVDGKEADSLMGHIDISTPFAAPTIR